MRDLISEDKALQRDAPEKIELLLVYKSVPALGAYECSTS